MLVTLHVIILFPGTSFLDTETKLWLAPFIGALVIMLYCSAWLVEHGRHQAARYLTNFTVSISVMLSVIMCGGFLESHATPFLLAPIVVAFCISPRREAVAVGKFTFFFPLIFDGIVHYFGWEIPNYTSTANPTVNTIYLLTTLFVTIFISLTYLQKTNSELHLALDREQEILRQWATIDPLTQIGNRRTFDLILEEARSDAVARGCGFGLVYLDLNGFKKANDEFGHEVGDQILKVVAKRLVEILGEDGCAVRVGGDEFAIVLPGPVDRHQIELLMDGIHQVVGVPIEAGEGTHQISASIGKAMFPNDATSISDLIRAADLDMYASKMKEKLKAVSEKEFREEASQHEM